MKKNRLIIDYNYEFDLLGVISSVKFYKLAWAINQKLKIRLVKQEDYQLEIINGKVRFMNYLYVDENSSFQLFKNRSVEGDQSYLIPEMIHIDYVVKIDSITQSFVKQEILKELKEIKWIEYIAEIEVEKLKSKDNFLN